MNQHQRGSVLSYSLVAVLLAILLIGGIVYFKNSTTKIATTPFQPTTEGSTNQNTDRTAQNDAALKQQSTSTNQGTSQSSSSSSAASSSNSSTSSMPTTSTVTTAALPTTGPGDIAFPLLGASLLAGSVIAYRRSRLAL